MFIQLDGEVAKGLNLKRIFQIKGCVVLNVARPEFQFKCRPETSFFLVAT